VNFRDLGGYPVADGRTVRWRKIFRSDGLDTLSPADLAHLVDELGLASVIDLRSGDEVESVGRGPLGETRLAFHHIPILDETRRLFERAQAGLTISDLYAQMAERAGDRFVAALRVVAATDSPLVFHCAAGKDRTGMLGALLLDLLGVADQHIADDYAHSARIAPVLRRRLEARLAARAGRADDGGSADPDGAAATDTSAPGWARTADELLSARPATIMGVLGALRAEYGSVEQWARAHGMPDDELGRLRDRLLA
jgi:protein-tyrosine phosphatase